MVIPKKYYGQHFLKEKSIAEKISNALQLFGKQYEKVLEIGPGPGILTDFLYHRFKESLYMVEIDEDMIPALQAKFPTLESHIIKSDFLELNLGDLFHEPFALIGNFPYNISSQILFKTVEYRKQIPEMVGMFQREVAQRVVAPSGTKVYGLISVWVQAFYDVEYLFTVSEGSFNPPPKVKSGVIRLVRKNDFQLEVDEDLLLKVIKAAFNQRRKTLRNALSLYKDRMQSVPEKILDLRAEALSAQDFIELTQNISHP